MSIPQSKVQAIGLSALLFVAVLLFYALCYPNHLHYQEQYQMFLFDRGYLSGILALPGGMSDMAGRFLTQFFVYAWVGSSIMAVLLTGVFLLSLRMAKPGWLQGLSLLPVVILWVFCCDEDALVGAVVALVMGLLADWGLTAVSRRGLRLLLRLASAPLLYWMFGPVAIVTGILGLIASVGQRDRGEILASIGSILLFVLMPLVGYCWVAMPLERLYLSPHYYRSMTIVPVVLWIAVAALIIVPMLPSKSPNRFMSLAVWTVVIVSGGWSVKMHYNGAAEDVMAYDFMARFQQWNRIVGKANQKPPRNAISCTALNLALGIKGQLADHLFDYPQNGMLGLLPDYSRDPISPLTTAEVYYQLGLINSAQHYVFEAQEAIQDYQKSSRCFMRLAETNLINGNYEVARKYLLSLQKTLFYKDWAEQRLSLLNNEEAIAQHPEYGRLRQMMPDQDYLFRDCDIPTMFRRQVLANNENHLAHQYLQAAYLLSRTQGGRRK